MSSSPISKECWLVVEDKVTRIFINKFQAVDYAVAHKTNQVFHRYTDGTIHPLLVWPDQNQMLANHIESDNYGKFDEHDDYKFDEDIDFYEVCAALESFTVPVESKDIEPKDKE